MNYVVYGTCNLAEQGHKPKKRADARDQLGCACVAWTTAQRLGKSVKLIPTAYGYAVVADEKKEAIPMGHPYYEVTPEGVVTAYKWEL